MSFEPPCRRCGSEIHWALGREGEQCDNCNWPASPLESPIIIERTLKHLRALLTEARKHLEDWEVTAFAGDYRKRKSDIGCMATRDLIRRIDEGYATRQNVPALPTEGAVQAS